MVQYQSRKFLLRLRLLAETRGRAWPALVFESGKKGKDTTGAGEMKFLNEKSGNRLSHVPIVFGGLRVPLQKIAQHPIAHWEYLC